RGAAGDSANWNKSDSRITLTYLDFTFNSAPSDIGLSNSSIAENQPGGSAIGVLSTIDPEGELTFFYALVSGTGSTDNLQFMIDGATLKTNAFFNFEARSSYSIRVRSTDGSGLFTEKAFTIHVTDMNEAPAAIDLSSDTL